MVCIGVFAGCATYKITYQKGLITRTETLEKKDILPRHQNIQVNKLFQGNKSGSYAATKLRFHPPAVVKNQDMKRIETSTHTHGLWHLHVHYVIV